VRNTADDDSFPDDGGEVPPGGTLRVEARSILVLRKVA
jgi:hypothetical protein